MGSILEYTYYLLVNRGQELRTLGSAGRLNGRIDIDSRRRYIFIYIACRFVVSQYRASRGLDTQ